jgi:hypothetical protein
MIDRCIDYIGYSRSTVCTVWIRYALFGSTNRTLSALHALHALPALPTPESTRLRTSAILLTVLGSVDPPEGTQHLFELRRRLADVRLRHEVFVAVLHAVGGHDLAVLGSRIQDQGKEQTTDGG